MILRVFSHLNDSMILCYCSTICRSLEKVLGGKKETRMSGLFLSAGIFQLNSIKYKITWIVKGSYMYILTFKSYAGYISLLLIRYHYSEIILKPTEEPWIQYFLQQESQKIKTSILQPDSLLHLEVGQTSVFNHGKMGSYKLCFTFITVFQFCF